VDRGAGARLVVFAFDEHESKEAGHFCPAIQDALSTRRTTCPPSSGADAFDARESKEAGHCLASQANFAALRFLSRSARREPPTSLAGLGGQQCPPSLLADAFQSRLRRRERGPHLHPEKPGARARGGRVTRRSTRSWCRSTGTGRAGSLTSVQACRSDDRSKSPFEIAGEAAAGKLEEGIRGTRGW
jgi:hypothetical protein